ncbi:Glucose-1-phosphate thymidylyltransferase [subsurface metagenome]
MLPIYDQPMIFYPIKTLVKAGIEDIIIVTGGPHAGHFIRVLQNGKQLGVKHLEYAYQEKEGGIAEALSLCEDFTDKDSLTVILGDNCTDVNISKPVREFKKGTMVFLKEVTDPQRFGVPVFNKRKRIIKIEEKPKKPKSNFAVTGLYIYDNKVFNYIKRCRRSGRGELEITDVNNFYIRAKKLKWEILKGYWSDAGTFKSLYQASKFWAEKKGKLK